MTPYPKRKFDIIISVCFSYYVDFQLLEEKVFEDTKELIRIRKSKNYRQLIQWPKEKGYKD